MDPRRILLLAVILPRPMPGPAVVALGARYSSQAGTGGGIGNRPLTGNWPEVDEPLAAGEQIVCIEELGGVLKRYERRAA